MPYVDYFLNKDYIIEFLCINNDKPESDCNGNCHLNEQLKVASETNNETDDRKQPRVERVEIQYFIESECAEWNILIQDKTCFIDFFLNWRSTYQNDIFIPPKQFA